MNRVIFRRGTRAPVSAQYRGAALFILLLTLLPLLSGCRKSGSETYDKMMARTGTIQEMPPVTVIKLVGEAFIGGDETAVGEATRVAALLDALRKLALKDLEVVSPNLVMSDTTLVYRGEWDGLKLRAETTRRRGVVISDNVEVTLPTDNGARRYFKWRTENMKLVEPAPGDDTRLNLLKEAMRVRGFDMEGNHRLGQDTWCELVSYKCWASNKKVLRLKTR